MSNANDLVRNEGLSLANSPAETLKALKDLKELTGHQSVGVHLREMYLAWLGSENLNNVDSCERPSYFESYEAINLLLKRLESDL